MQHHTTKLTSCPLLQAGIPAGHVQLDFRNLAHCAVTAAAGLKTVSFCRFLPLF